MTGNPFVWVEIYVQDLGRAKKFYESVFQITLNRLDNAPQGMELWAFPMEMDHWGAGGALVKIEGVPSGGGGTLSYFTCEDCAIEEQRSNTFGGSVHKSKTSIGQYGFISLVIDTEGNMIGLHSMK
ncbi:MAG: VOC family protein [Thermodesulfovibrionales bacterium]